MALQTSVFEKEQKIQQESSPQKIPSITFRTMDEAVVEYFDRKFPLLIDGRKVPTIFAGPERWAQVQRDSYLKDKDGMLILPVMAVRRLSPEINTARHVPKAAETNVIIKKVSQTKANSRDNPNLQKPIYDCYSIPYPRFVLMNYILTIWASHYTEINDFQQRYLWEGAAHKFMKDGFWFLGRINSINDNSNTEDNTRQERIQKLEYSLVLEGYILNSHDVVKIPSVNQVQMTQIVEEEEFYGKKIDYKFKKVEENPPVLL